MLLEAEVDVDGTNLTVVGTHFSHLEFGSPLQTRALRRGLPPTDRAAVFLGDMNMWGWTIVGDDPVRAGDAVGAGKTWPAHRPATRSTTSLVTPSVGGRQRRGRGPRPAPTIGPSALGCVVT